MMRALWVDTVFDDGATARGIAHLPAAVCDLLAELSTAGQAPGRPARSLRHAGSRRQWQRAPGDPRHRLQVGGTARAVSPGALRDVAEGAKASTTRCAADVEQHRL